MDRSKRHRQPCQRAEQHCNDTRQIAGQQEQNCLLDVLIDISAILHCLDNGGEIVVRQNHCRSVLGNLCTGDAHCHAYISLFQCRCIVDTVTGHGNDIATLLPCTDNANLMLRCHTGINRFVCHKVHQLLVGVSVQCRTLYSFFRLFQNADLLGDRRSGDNVVTGDHYRLDSGRSALCNCLFGFLTGRIHFGNQSQIGQVVFVLNAQRITGERLCRKTEYTQTLFRQFFHLFHNFLLLCIRTCHAVQQHVCCTLGVHFPHITVLVQGRHQLAVGVKGNLADAGMFPTHFLIGQPAVLGKPHQSRFRRVTDLGAVLTCGITAQHGSQNQFLFLRIFRTDIFGGNDMILHHDFPDGHLVLCQSTGFIRTNDGNRTQSLDCL